MGHGPSGLLKKCLQGMVLGKQLGILLTLRRIKWAVEQHVGHILNTAPTMWAHTLLSCNANPMPGLLCPPMRASP